jgi:hypothetical protein
MEEEVDPEPAKPRPVLPYSPGIGNEFRAPLPPAHDVYRQFGLMALGLALFACGTAVGAAVQRILPTDAVGLMQLGCCCGSFSWLLSVCLSVVVAARDTPGRKWALIALVLDMLLVGLLAAFAGS